jgi:hypothetical protein
MALPMTANAELNGHIVVAASNPNNKRSNIMKTRFYLPNLPFSRLTVATDMTETSPDDDNAKAVVPHRRTNDSYITKDSLGSYLRIEVGECHWHTQI